MIHSSNLFFAFLLFLPRLSKGFTATPQWTQMTFPKGQIVSMAAAHDNDSGEKNAVQDWDVDLYQNHHSFVWEYGASLVDLLDPQPRERILDVGCGSGELAQTISEKGADVVGIDADPRMIEKAAAGFPNITFRCADASKLQKLLLGDDDEEEASSSRGRPFDAIFSNAALHWVTDTEASVAGMSSLLKPGGRFVVEFGGRGNIQCIVDASLDVVRKRVPGTVSSSSPWYFPSIAEYSSLLEAHGIEVESAILYDRPTILQDGDRGMKHWLGMFGDVLFRDVVAASKKKEAMIEAVVDQLRQSTDLYDRNKREWTADYRRIRIVGKKVSR
jgi:trans-aconitate methyltransferase